MKGLLKRTFLWIALIVITIFLWLIAQLGPLYPFLPHTFEVIGGPFTSKNYLVLLQNNAEMRPTGGFISAYAELNFMSGIPTKIEVNDVYSLKGYDDDTFVEPPYPMGEMLKDTNYKGHSLHDANWYPDLATSSKDILKFYEDEFPDKKVDGVFVINYSFVEELVELLGNVKVGDKTFTRGNLFHTIEYEQNNIDRHNKEEILNRKGILGDLAPKIIKGIAFNPALYNKAAATTRTALDNKEIQFYFKDSKLEDKMTDLGVTNTFPEPSTTRDIFAPIVANLGGMKSDRYISRDFSQIVTYSRTQAEQEYALTTTQRLSFDHFGDYDAPLNHVFRGYIRSYLPKDAKLLTYPEDADIYEEMGYMIIGKQIAIDPGKSETLEFSYSLPLSYIKDAAYSTYVYKQSGLENTAYHVTFSGPVDQLLSTEGFQNVKETVARYSSLDQQDAELSIKLSEDKTPPRVTFQQFVDYNRIIVQFNEPILAYDCTNKENYILSDTDLNVPTITNKPTIKEVRCKDREATIFTNNIRTQYGEAFRLELRNMRDLSNNIISPNPRPITIIQRMDQDKPKEEAVK